MKKIIASTLGLMMVGGVAATTASAVENQFGGYWRTRAFVQDEFAQDGESYGRIDNRTRLYYTAKFNDNFKFVNKFEIDSNWGSEPLGDVGSDGMVFEVKHSYADFTLGNVRTKLGIQGHTIARGFLFDDDFSGIVVSPNLGNVTPTLGYISEKTEDGGGYDYTEGIAFLQVGVQVSDNFNLTPYFVYYSADEGTSVDDEGVVSLAGDWDSYYLGADFDMKMDAASVWGTLIYNGGDYGDDDISAFLGALGVDAGIAHGQVFYATGDDDAADGDMEAFFNPVGRSYYWSEIMGYGVFDNNVSANAPGDGISNVLAVNAGVTVKPADKLTLSADLWYAMLAEDNAAGEDELGFEVDGKLTYALMDNLNLDAVLAYLAAGDATGDDDVFEGGVRVSLSF
ncbi:hypothetical protein SAMN05660330_01015 [Desulforhopalus singaporensis]|uniref:Uncharacterized protein n=1 Tax=Desulforhopalus singaporensis TaxID=91360 RepID=A0A1H0M7H1_9BACT|nr:hypothetical protein SAMN05660330_01015 [Desulforhopalus singaporensis]